MIQVLIPFDEEYKMYRKECKALYEKLQNKINDINTFEFIENNTLFYLFAKDNELIGAIYYFIDTEGGDGKKLFLNGFAKRKKHQLCLECLKMSLDWFFPPIYAEAQNKASALCLLKCGFKRVEGCLFVKK